MTFQDIKTNWYYFKALASQLQNTTQYVEHDIDLNGQTFSNEFAKILMLSASEFEVICKSLCKESGISLSWNANIVSITNGVLSVYPKIGQTTVMTPYLESLKPLENWKVDKVLKNNRLVNRVVGIDWWEAHNNVKHDRGNYFKKATLNNCIYSMASLMVVELYLSQIVVGDVNEISTIGCDYFSFEYGLVNLEMKCADSLPDFRKA